MKGRTIVLTNLAFLVLWAVLAFIPTSRAEVKVIPSGPGGGDAVLGGDNVWTGTNQFTTIELGHASANTLSASSGVLSIEGVAQIGASGTHTLAGTYNVTGTANFEVGSGTGTVQPAGLLCKGAPNTTTSTTDEEVLATCTIPANTLSADGAAIWYYFTAHTAATANTKQLFVRVGGLGGAAVFATAANAANDDVLRLNSPCVVTRESASTATSTCFLQTSTADITAGGIGTTTFNDISTMIATPVSIDWTSAQDFVITADTNTAAGGLTLDTFWVQVFQ